MLNIMKETLEKNTLINTASVSGAILGVFTIVCTALSNVIAGAESPVLASVLNIIIWLLKFVGCILIMRWAMKKFAGRYEGVRNRQVFILGMLSALFSAILVSAYSYIYMEFINPEQLKEAMDMVYQSMSGMMDSNTLEEMQSMESKMPAISFFSSLIYCFLYGTILSSILSGGIISDNPFEDEEK